MACHRLIVTAESQDFDAKTLQNWRDEGFEASYLAYDKPPQSNRSYVDALEDTLKSMGSETYAIVAFGEPAALILDMAHSHDFASRLCALVAYYPLGPPLYSYEFPSKSNVLVHYAGRPSAAHKARQYIYPDVQLGFAEKTSKNYDKVAANLAWSRTLATLRKGFEIEVDLEQIWENHVELEFATRDADATMATMVAEPYVNHIPTLTGGIGYRDLHRFYRDYFIPGNPPSLKMRLLSRTVGVDRVVDEMFVSFKHTQVIPWMLPEVEPTNKEVEVALVAIVCIRGGKLYHEHIYWDQATVLVQIGLLDPRILPGNDGKGRLPVVDAAGARKVVDESSTSSNQLIRGW